MKKMLFLLFSVSLVFLFLGTASALTMTDYADYTDITDSGWGAPEWLDGVGDYVAWTHTFDFDPPAAEILSATLSIGLYDDERDYFLAPWTWEFGFGVAEDGSFDIGPVNPGVYDYDVALWAVADGSFSVLVKSIGGDFGVSSSTLTVDYAPVPEPGTIVLMGLGLVGLAGMGRKKLFKK